ncbi:MAG: amidase [Deltaproteobacteria bacterium]|nr:amidase [Deltaproteobacteria bacterium]
MNAAQLGLESQSIRDIAQNIRAQKFTCTEAVQFYLARINRLNSSIRALSLVNGDQALQRASEYSREIAAGTSRGRLHGVCFTAKDSTDVEGLPTRHGSTHGEIQKSPRNSTIVQRLLDEGAICVGKGNMAEYGKSYYTDNPVFGRTSSPFDLTRTPGGSSGGDAAALASNFASFAVVSDSGGSVRVPANFSGLFGLYPSRGILSDGGMSSPPHAISCLFRRNGFLARHLSDLELLLSVTSGADAADPYSISPPPWAVDMQFAKKRFLYYSAMNGVESDPQIAAELRSTVKKLEAQGYVGEERCPSEFSSCFEIFIILAAQASLMLEDLLAQESGHPRNLSSEGPTIQNLRQRIATELPALTPQSVLRCWAKVDQLRFSAQKLWDKYDFVLAPVTATLPPAHGTAKYKVGSQELWSQQVFQFASCVNVLGFPAVAFPTGLSVEKLPLGLQIIGPQFSEYAMIRALRGLGYTSCLSPSQSS